MFCYECKSPVSLLAVFGASVQGWGQIHCVKYKYVYFPIAKYKYDHFHIVEYKYSLSSTNSNFKMLIYFTIPILLLTTTHFPTFYLCYTVIVNLQVLIIKLGGPMIYCIFMHPTVQESQLLVTFVSLQCQTKCVFDLWLC